MTEAFSGWIGGGATLSTGSLSYMQALSNTTSKA
jgi:hypothetical protein